MKLLDKSRFSTIFVVLALRTPPRLIQKVLDLFSKKNILLNIPKIRTVVNDLNLSDKLILFNSHIKAVQELPEETIKFIEEHQLKVCQHSLELNYEHLSVEQVFRELLPPSIPIPASFETIGHIAHLNLREEHAAHKYLIGEILLDKHQPRIKTVVNKLHTIENIYRCLPLEILAGENNLVTEVHENSCVFKLDFEKVYWNSRLHTEHERLVHQFFGKNDIVVDMFAGVGPFAIPAVKLRNSQVYANDLNPDSYFYLCENMKLNHIDSKSMKVYNTDARLFLLDLVTIERVKQINHIVMNLPTNSIEFLDVIPKIQETLIEPYPLIHCYHFIQSSKGQTEKNLLDTCIEEIRRFIPYLSEKECICYHRVRDVSPSKEMYCLSFRLPSVPPSSTSSIKRPKLE